MTDYLCGGRLRTGAECKIRVYVSGSDDGDRVQWEKVKVVVWGEILGLGDI